MSCAVTIYTHIDTVMLGFLTSDADVGFYDAAIKVKRVLLGLVTSLSAVLLPRSSYYVKQGLLDRFHAVSAKALNFVFVAATPLCVYFIIFARQGILFLAGGSYLDSVLPMRIIMPTVLLIGITNILGIQILLPLGREKTVLHSEITGALINICVNAVLVPQLAAVGAAIGNLTAECAVLIFQYHALRHEATWMLARIAYLKIILAALAATLSACLLICQDWSNFLTLITSGCVFFAVYGVVLYLAKEQLSREAVAQLLSCLRAKFF